MPSDSLPYLGYPLIGVQRFIHLFIPRASVKVRARVKVGVRVRTKVTIRVREG